DVAGKIFVFSQKRLRAICIISANGVVSNVTIRQPCTSGGMSTYEVNNDQSPTSLSLLFSGIH
ncbi:hypothetical protein MKW92_048444, partial [Papaver armeniacum]